MLTASSTLFRSYAPEKNRDGFQDAHLNSLAKLTSEEQKAMKPTAFDLQMNPDRIAVKVINHLGDEVVKVYQVEQAE